MRILTLPLLIFCAGCNAPIEYVPVAPVVPEQLLAPCPISERIAATWRDLAILATEHLRAAECGNADKEALREILKPKEH